MTFYFLYFYTCVGCVAIVPWVAAKMATGENFLKWLNSKLRELKTDENVYGSYIIGILEGDESIEEKKEALEEILSQIIVSKGKIVELTLRLVVFVFIYGLINVDSHEFIMN